MAIRLHHRPGMTRSRSPRGFTIIKLMVVASIIGALTTTVVTNFMKYQARAKQSEAKANLRSIFTAQKARFADKDAYSVQGDLIGFAPERGSRYFYRLDANCAGGTWTRSVSGNASPAGSYSCITQEQARFDRATPTFSTWTATLTSNATTAEGVSPNCPNCGFTASATGNVDQDTRLRQLVHLERQRERHRLRVRQSGR